MRILFINQHSGSATVPLASAALASELESQFGNDVQCAILEPPPGFDVTGLCREITALKPDIIALTLYVWSRNNLLNLASELLTKPENKNLICIAGGPEVTADAAAIQAHPSVHLAVAGEGEQAVAAIIGTLLPLNPDRRVSGLAALPAPWFAPPVEKLDSLSSPWSALALSGREYEDTVWELTRGCPFSCHFCYESRGRGGVRHKSPERVKFELAQIRSRDADQVFILDPTFNASKTRAVEILKLLISEAPEISFHIEVRTEFLDEEQAELFGELGCTLQVGLQTSDPEVARRIGRPFSLKDFRNKILLLHENGVTYGLDLIYGLPGDNLDGFRESLNFALRCAPNHLDIFPLAVLPGTRLRDDAAGLGLNHLNLPPYTVTGTDTADEGAFTADDLNQAGILAARADELYNRGRAVPWFLTVAGNLEISPVEILVAYGEYCADHAPSAGAGEAERPAHLGAFIRHLSDTSGHEDFREILGDITTLFTLESAYRQNLPLPETISFGRNPEVLLEHLDMGIADIDELMAFVPSLPGSPEYFRIAVSETGTESAGVLRFIRET